MNKIDRFLLYIISSILLINLFITAAENLNNLNTMLVIAVIIVAVSIYNELFVINEEKKWIEFGLCILIIFSLSTYINIYGTGSSVRVYYFIIMYQIYKKVKKKIAFLWFGFILGTHLLITYYMETSMKQVIKLAISEIFLFMLVSIIIMLVFYIIDQNKQLEEMKYAITLKNCELEQTHIDLLKAYNKLEEYTIINERSKIAREMHDTVGHTLTTALVELEVSKLLLNKNKEESEGKLVNAIEQVRKGLYDLRTSVKTLKNNVDYINEINELIINTEKHTGVVVRGVMDNLQDLDKKILGCVYRILQEGITNGIKHGNATAFLFKLNIEYIDKIKVLKIFLQDNGYGATAFTKGFGTNAMEERVSELKGTIKFESQKGAGFGIYAEIPIY